MQNPELRPKIDLILKRAGHIRKFLDVESCLKEIDAHEAQMGMPNFWDNQDMAQQIVGATNKLKSKITPILKYGKKLDDLTALADLAEESDGDDALELEAEIAEMIQPLQEELDAIEIGSFLNSPMDKNNAILTIHAGAGGTESCDWADMLFRMYVRWAERRGFTVEVEDIADGEEAGISRATIRIIGENAYGYIKAERGVHRLVRISPFDSNKRRHTSFCAVDVIGEIEDDLSLDFEIKDEELRIDVYRASGKGGQHVNRTESAVRLTHLETGIVVACQNERSQHKNKERAMKILKSRIYEKRLDEKRAEMERFYGAKNEMGWGNQIRSYVFQPYQMVKDLRTGTETGNIQAVMDGELDRFIHAWLRAGCPRTRNKDIQIED